MRKSSIEITPDFCIVWAIFLLILPLQWILAAAIAALTHECCHYLMLKLLGVSVYGISIGVNGAIIETEPMRPHQELICALAGPLGSFLLLIPARWVPLISLCGGVQGLYNLIPVMPFDGGRVLRSVLEIRRVKSVCFVMNMVRSAVCFLIILAGILGLRYGLLPVVISMLVVGKMLPRKRPCKEDPKRVQ